MGLSFGAAALLAGCEGDDGSQGPPGPPGSGGTETDLEQGDETPGVDLTILAVRGGSGPGGNFRVGDRITIDYQVRKDDGSDWDLSEFSRGRALVSGPTFNYQRVIPEVSDVITESTENADGSYTYRFSDPLPAVYAPPYNDSPAYDETDGELTGQDLLDGTYTVGLYFRWSFEVDGDGANEADNATADFLFGAATTVTPREVVTQDNCNRCHADLQAHGGMRKDITLCLMCHTSGSEDRSGTGASVDFRVMVHKIHNGKHLPSVLGVGTNPDGSRDYDATPQPYVLEGFSTGDFSDVGFPVFPNLNSPMPRDTGYAMLSPEHRALEDQMRSGVTSCATCHGDPDGDGPAAAPAQGGLAYSQPTRRSCGSCHDDIDWDLPYTANTQTMPPQNDDATCTLCHDPAGNSLAVEDGHLHPLLDPAFGQDLVFDVSSVVEAPGGNGNGSLDAGEKLLITMTLQDGDGVDVDPSTLNALDLVVSGPTSNLNLLLYSPVPPDALVGPQPFVFNAPERVNYELLGDSMPGTPGEVFTTDLAPHWNGPTTPTTVWSRAPTMGGTTLAAAASAYENFIDVADAAGFAANDVIVIDDAFPASEEYLRVQWVDGNRLWFASPNQPDYVPALRMDHPVGATVQVAALTELTAGVDYVLDDVAGTVTESGELGAVAVVASYTSDFVLPMAYAPTLNDSPDLGEEVGEWTGKSLVDGTYTATLWGGSSFDVDVFGTTTTYRGTAPPATHDFLVGDATRIEPYDLIDGAANCYNCHQDLWFHGGGRRGFETCLACHGLAGAEDRPQYRAWDAPPTTGVQVSFREMLHKIHMGEDLANAMDYVLVGFGPGGPPDNFSTHTYENVVFPPLPGGPRNCEMCHGTSDAWQSPSDRDHPTEQGVPVLEWGGVCGSCHDTQAATAHIQSQTVNGSEACAVCHDPGKEWGVDRMHKSY